MKGSAIIYAPKQQLVASAGISVQVTHGVIWYCENVNCINLLSTLGCRRILRVGIGMHGMPTWARSPCTKLSRTNHAHLIFKRQTLSASFSAWSAFMPHTSMPCFDFSYSRIQTKGQPFQDLLVAIPLVLLYALMNL